MAACNFNKRLEVILERALELPPEERTAYLEGACGDDVALRKKVDDLLFTESRMGSFIRDPTLGREEMEDEMSALIGSFVGSYKLLQQIGEGGCGVVYLAEQYTPVNRRVAMKVIKLGMDTRQVIARFEAERQALAMMDHPNIAKVYDAGATEAGRPYFVMELVRGLSITKYCDQSQLATKERLPIFAQVCRAVHHAHQKGVIHRDLKPSNILVTLHDGVPVPKVIDFGIAKATNVRLTEKTLFTDFHQFVGTPAYTSPEHVEMSGMDVDTRSDIYSLGVVLYELLTGTTPIEAETLKKVTYSEVQRTILETVPPKPSARLTELRRRSLTDRRLRTPPSELERDLDWITMKALEKDRQRRYESASAFADDVQRFLSNEPVTAAAPGTIYRIGKFVSRHRAAAVVIATLLIGSLVSMVSGFYALRFSKLERAARILAEQSDATARRHLYIADMNVAQTALRQSNLDRTISLLRRHIPKSPDDHDFRGFEWRHLWQQVHRELFTLETDADPIYTLALSPNDQWLASVTREGVVRLWDLASRQLLHSFDVGLESRGRYGFVDFSPDNKALAACADSRQGATSDVVVWDINSRQETRRFSVAPGREYGGFGFMPDGRLMAAVTHPVADRPAQIHLMDPSSGEQEIVPLYEKPFRSVDVASHAMRLVASFADDTVLVYDLERQIVRSVLDRPKLRLGSVAISADGQRICGSGFLTKSPARSFLWDIDKLEESVHTFDYDFPSHGEVFSPDGKTLGIEEITGRIRLYDTDTGERLAVYDQAGVRLTSLAFTANNQLILSSSENGRIMAWPGRAALERNLLRTSASITTIDYSPDGKYLAAGLINGSVEVFHTETKEQVLAVPAVVEERENLPDDLFVDYFAFSPDSRRLAVGARVDPRKSPSEFQEKAHVAIWTLGLNEDPQRLPHSAFVRRVAWARDGRLATGTDLEGGLEAGEGVVRLWDASLTNETLRMTVPGGAFCLTFSPDSRVLAGTGDGNSGVHLWDTATGNELRELTNIRGHVDDNRAVAFSHDSGLAAVLGGDGNITIYTAANWEILRQMPGHGPGMDLAFSPDGKRIVSTGYENLCKLWDVETGNEVASFPGIVADFSPDGETLAIGGSWRIPIGEDPDARTIRLIRAPVLERFP